MRALYRFVDILTANGIDAAIVHQQVAFRCSWFVNTTKIEHIAQVRMGAGDLLMLPEEFAHLIPVLAPGVGKVLLNQNVYFMFRKAGFFEPYASLAYQHPELLGAIVMSDDAAEYMRWAFPALHTERVRYGICERLWTPAPDRERDFRAVAFMPRRRREEATNVFQVLHHRGALRGWRLRPVDGLGEDAAARVVRSCGVFFAFSEREGFGLPPAEAMRAGLVVTGWPGLGGREYMLPAHSFPVPEGDIQAYARIAESVLRAHDSRPEAMAYIRSAAAEFVASRYNSLEEAQQWQRCVRSFLDRSKCLPSKAPRAPIQLVRGRPALLTRLYSRLGWAGADS